MTWVYNDLELTEQCNQ